MKVIRTHPKGMYLLGVTATLHNFAFLGVVTLFPFFMTRAFDLTEGEATQAYGAFFGVALVLPLVGGQFPKTRFPERPLLAESSHSTDFKGSRLIAALLAYGVGRLFNLDHAIR